MKRYGVTTDYDYNQAHKRERLCLWSGAFFDQFEASALSLPNGAGYMLTVYAGQKIRVACPAPRTDSNYVQVDAALSEALTAFYSTPAQAPTAIVIWPEHLAGQSVELVSSPAEGIYNCRLESGESMVIHSDNLQFPGQEL